jgi:hypothetical protein
MSRDPDCPREAAQRAALAVPAPDTTDQERRFDMVLALAIAVLSVVGVIGAVVASVLDPRIPTRTIWGYDTRRPQP